MSAEKMYVDYIVSDLENYLDRMTLELKDLDEDEYYQEHSDDAEMFAGFMHDEYNDYSLEALRQAIDRGVSLEGLRRIALWCFDDAEAAAMIQEAQQ